MQKWIAFLLSGVLVLAFIIGLFIQPLDSEANSNSYWKADFYNNTELAGDSVYSRTDRQVNFNWAAEAPAPGVNEDRFSVRWSGRFEFEAGEWQFVVGADDGVRLWVNNSLLIDQWASSESYTVHKATIALEAGNHDLRLEYYDASDLAGVSVTWEVAPAVVEESTTDVASPQQVAPDSSNNLAQNTYPVANVATGVLNVREGPAIQYQRITQIFLYQRYRILGQNSSGTWYQIDLGDGSTGWVSARYVIVTGEGEIPVIDFQVGDPETVFEGASGDTLYRLNVREAPSTDAAIIDILNYNVTVQVAGRDSTSVWYRISYENGTGWVFAPYISLNDVPAYDIPFIEQ